MIDIQVNSTGIELLIDFVEDYDYFDSVIAKIISPTGAITTLITSKNTQTVARVPLVSEITEIGIYRIQLEGNKNGYITYSQVGELRAHNNLKDLF